MIILYLYISYGVFLSPNLIQLVSIKKKNLTHKEFIYSNDILKELDFRFINCFYIKNV